jgi:hypothetical protein
MGGTLSVTYIATLIEIIVLIVFCKWQLLVFNIGQWSQEQLFSEHVGNTWKVYYNLSVCLSVRPSVRLSAGLSVRPSVCLSVCLK